MTNSYIRIVLLVMAAALSAWAQGDSGFVKKAAASGMAEVELGKLAAQKASNPAVKQFAQNMMHDHTQADNELKQLAQKKNIGLANQLDPSHNDERQRLQSLSGADFDRQYIDIMVFEHQQAVDQFERESKDGSDAEVRGYAGRQLSVLHQHLNAAKALQGSLGGK
jgi:putative membrane protein